jgi:predicted GIY-YIG superfamily endonuclease
VSKLDDHIARIVDQAPPLSADQIYKLRRLLGDDDMMGPPSLRPAKQPVSPPPVTVPAASERCALYWYYAANRTLLYIGITTDLDQRDNAHRSTAVWYPFQVRRDVIWFESKGEAETAEAHLIKAQKPLFNLRDRRTPISGVAAWLIEKTS